MTNEEKVKQVQDMVLVEPKKLNDLFSEYKKVSLKAKKLEERIEKYFNDQFNGVEIHASCYSGSVEIEVEIPKTRFYESIRIDEHALMAIFESNGRLTIEDLFNVHMEKVNRILNDFKNKDKCKCGHECDFSYCESCGDKYCENCCDCDSSGEHCIDMDVMLEWGWHPISFEISYCQKCINENIQDLIEREIEDKARWGDLDYYDNL